MEGKDQSMESLLTHVHSLQDEVQQLSGLYRQHENGHPMLSDLVRERGRGYWMSPEGFFNCLAGTSNKPQCWAVRPIGRHAALKDSLGERSAHSEEKAFGREDCEWPSRPATPLLRQREGCSERSTDSAAQQSTSCHPPRHSAERKGDNGCIHRLTLPPTNL